MMLDAVREYWAHRTPNQLARDLLDILIVYYVVYRALVVLRGTRAMQVGVGLGVVFVLYIVAQLLKLVTLLTILGALISSIILVIVVVFQSDIRRGLQRVGSRAWFGGLHRVQEAKVIDEVVDAATDLARHRTGAIIAFEQDANLDEFVGVHKGHLLDAAVSRELLVSLFVPEAMNKLHDGAVIIRNLRIAKAGVFFPMPEARVVDESFGSRHRAALGITEETDAVVVVVSEERGTISFCFNGNIAANLDGPKLKTMLEAIFSPKVRKSKRRAEAKRAAPAIPAVAEPPSSKRDVEPSSRPPVLEITLPIPTPEPLGSLKSRPRATDSEPPGPTPLRRSADPDASGRLPAVQPVRTPTATLKTATEALERTAGEDAGEEDDEDAETSNLGKTR